MNACYDSVSDATSAVTNGNTRVMKFYRSLLDSGEFEYARVHGDVDRAEYFDDELRIWMADDSLLAEINDGTWIPCSEHEGEHAAQAWPGTSHDLSRALA
jgi:hypothetical protein